MSDSTSPRPTGSDSEALFHQNTWDRAHGPASKIRSTSTVKVQTTPGGIFLHANGGGGSGSLVQFYKITSLYNHDYVKGKLWNASSNTVTGSEIAIAKSVWGRMLPNETIDGELITYDYNHNSYCGDNLRYAIPATHAQEWHVMHPRYTTNDVIPVVKISGGTGVQDDNGANINYLELAARFWAYQADQSGIT